MGAKGNNFKKIMEEEEAFLSPPPNVQERVVSNLSFLEFFGKTIELFIPRILELMISMTGGTIKALKEEEVLDLSFLTEDKGESDHDDNDTPGDAIPDTN